jgi:hypothetical protein
MGGDTGFGTSKLSKTRGFTFAVICLAALAAGCSKSEPQDTGILDTSRLPRLSGAKEIFASPASTMFTSTDPVPQAADAVNKALIAAGWQKYVAPHTATSQNATLRILSLKKGAQGLSVMITVAPAQKNATSVQYSAIALKNDLPFEKDATDIEFDPNRPLLTLITAEPIDKTLDFYRKELAPRGWSLWSQRLNGVQPAGGASGELTPSGAYAYYVQDDKRIAALVLEHADGGRTKVKFEEQSPSYLESMKRQFFNSDNTGAALVDVQTLPRLDGAEIKVGRSKADRVEYTVPGPLADTIAALKTKLGAGGWKLYVAPLEERYWTSMDFKNGRQGLSVGLTIQVGTNEQTSKVTTVSYAPARLNFALAVPGDATDIVFDENRPYLNLNSAATVDATLDFYRKELGAMGWSPLSAADATTHWPDAKLHEKPSNGAIAYFVRGTRRPIVLTLLHREDGKTNAEIKVPPFAEVQTVTADSDEFGLPRPKPAKTSGGIGGTAQHEVHAHVLAEVPTVLAFYRRELTARNWKEESQGAVVKPNEVTLNFTSPDGPAVLKLTHRYDMTVVSLVQHLTPKPAAPIDTPAKTAEKAIGNASDKMNDAMKEMQQMMRDAGVQQKAAPQIAQQAAPAPKAPEAALSKLAGNKAPVPVPDTAQGVEFDAAGGRLEFSSPSSIQAVADFYRSAMKEQGWDSRSSVVNNANIVMLNFAKGGKDVSFTIMKMGPKTNVSAHGPGLKTASANSSAPAGAPAATADKTNAPAKAEDLVAEESGGLPMPKRHTMSEGSKSTFRRELKASVPLALSDVLGFYRRELGKLNWKEQAAGAVVAPDHVNLAYTSPGGPAILKLGRKNGETTVNLAVRDPGAAAKAGVMPKTGQAKVLVSNMTDVDAVLIINKQTFKAVPNAGTKKPDGPMLDLAPGKYKVSSRLAGKPAHDDEIEVFADQTWGLLIGPGGVLPLQVY